MANPQNYPPRTGANNPPADPSTMAGTDDEALAHQAALALHAEIAELLGLPPATETGQENTPQRRRVRAGRRAAKQTVEAAAADKSAAAPLPPPEPQTTPPQPPLCQAAGNAALTGTANAGSTPVAPPARVTMPPTPLAGRAQITHSATRAKTPRQRPDANLKRGRDTLTETGEPGQNVTVAEFDEAYNDFQALIFNLIYHMVGDRELAHDLTQDTFVKAYRTIERGSGPLRKSLHPWLCQVARHTATDALRHRGLISWVSLSLFNQEELGTVTGAPEQPTRQFKDAASFALAIAGRSSLVEQQIVDQEVIGRVLARMPEKYREALLLEIKGFTFAEIGGMLGISPSAVKMRVWRGRMCFAKFYNEETGENRQPAHAPNSDKPGNQTSAARTAS